MVTSSKPEARFTGLTAATQVCWASEALLANCLVRQHVAEEGLAVL